MRCPSSVRLSSVVRRLSSLTFHIFDFSSKTAEQNSMKLYRKQDRNVLFQVCAFWAVRKNKDGRPGLWLAETLSTSPLKPLNGTQRNLTGSKISMSSTKFVFFGPIGKTRWPPWSLIGWDIFDFSSKTAEPNSTKLNRKQNLNILYHIFVFGADRKNKMAALTSDWLRPFRLLIWLRRTEFNETWQEARSQRLLPNLCFRTDRKNKMAALTSDWLRHFQFLLWKCWTESYQVCTFHADQKTRWPSWPLIGLYIFDFSSETADRKQDLNVLYQICAFGPIRKTRLPPWPLIGWGIFYFSSENAERNPTKFVLFMLIRKQDGRPGLWLAYTFLTSPLKPLNWIQWNLTGNKISTSSTMFVLFGPISKQKRLPWPQKRWHIVLRCSICGPLGLLFVD